MAQGVSTYDLDLRVQRLERRLLEVERDLWATQIVLRALAAQAGPNVIEKRLDTIEPNIRANYRRRHPGALPVDWEELWNRVHRLMGA
jgi:hypothetical protein